MQRLWYNCALSQIDSDATSTAAPYVIVVGGINCDITAHVDALPERETSNPGRISLSPGGVGRNIAENLAHLGVSVALCGAMGDDAVSQWVLSETRQAGVDTRAVRIAPTGRASIYLSVLGGGELDVAVSDMDAIEALTPADVRAMLNECIDRAPHGAMPAMIAADCNLSSAALSEVVAVANGAQVPLLIEPVSRAKATRLREVCGRIDVVTPNAGEVHHLRGGAAEIATWVVTRGRSGAAWWSAGMRHAELVAATPLRAENVNGAGDAFTAGLIVGIVHGLPTGTAVAMGIRAGTRTAAYPGSVDPTLRAADIAV